MYSNFLEPSEKGAKSYKTLKSYTKDELIEEIRILEHNLASTEEMYNRGVILNTNICNHFPEVNKWCKKIFDKDNDNYRLLTQIIE